MSEIRLSSLPKTWIFDIDGTLVAHNGYLSSSGDKLLPGVRDVFSQIATDDKVIFMTARKIAYRNKLEKFLHDQGIRFDQIMYDMPTGERILVNDMKPSGLITAYAINKERDAPLDMEITIDSTL